MTKLQRTTFEISRAAEYFDARQLSALVGVSQDEFASVCLKELVDRKLRKTPKVTALSFANLGAQRKC